MLKAIMRTRPGLKNTRGLRVHIDDGTGKPLCGERMGDRHTVTRTKDAEGKITVTLTPSADVRQYQECLIDLLDCRKCISIALAKAKAPKTEPAVADPVSDPSVQIGGIQPSSVFVDEHAEYQKFIEETAKTCKCSDGPCDSCLAGGVCDKGWLNEPDWSLPEIKEEDSQPAVV